MSRLASLLRTRGRRVTALVVGCVLVTALAVGLALFQPWRLFTHSYIDEALPGLSDAPTATSTAGTSLTTHPNSAAALPSGAVQPAAGPIIVSRGNFSSGEHHTTGTALLVRLPDGGLVVRLEDLSSSDGPDLHVVLATTEAGSGGVGDYLSLGKLKATDGNQNYAVPAGTDLTRFHSVAVWCKRFNAVFGGAPFSSAG